ncbi:MAG: hypothetical protein ACFFD1_10615 [Candidatus Thorarchaeota archaeon]
MVLNWNIEVVLDFSFALVALISGVVTLIKPNTRKIHSLHYIRIAIFIGFFSMLFDGISMLYINVPLSIIEGVLNFPLALSMIIGVNYILKDNYHSLGFTITFGLGFLLIFVSLLPGAAEVQFQGGYYRIPWTGLFEYLNLLFYSIIMGYVLYWGIKTVTNAPFLIKKEANLFFIGITIYSLASTVFYILYVFEPFFILVSTVLAIIGLLIFTFAIIIEPKLLYILPFTIYRIVVKDNQGYPLFDYDWSKSQVTENMFTGFINAVQLMSDEIIKMGGLLDVNLKEGILILHESKKVTVGLAASKTSKLLRDSVSKFTFDFETKFHKKLKESCRDMKEYETAYELIEKHFSNFPSRLIPSKSHPLLLTESLLKLPRLIETDLKKIVSDQNDFQFIKAEIYRSPESSATGFISLYNDIRKELEKQEKQNEGNEHYIDIK